MKKLIISTMLMVCGLFAATTVSAQYQDRTYQDPYNQNRQSRRNNERYNNYNQRYVVVNEYRYIQRGRRVYREDFRSTYNRRGILVSRVLTSRERMYRYENYRNGRYDNRNSQGIRFNVYLRF